jgi:hypothetical protein
VTVPTRTMLVDEFADYVASNCFPKVQKPFVISLDGRELPGKLVLHDNICHSKDVVVLRMTGANSEPSKDSHTRVRQSPRRDSHRSPSRRHSRRRRSRDSRTMDRRDSRDAGRWRDGRRGSGFAKKCGRPTPRRQKHRHQYARRALDVNTTASLCFTTLKTTRDGQSRTAEDGAGMGDRTRTQGGRNSLF